MADEETKDVVIKRYSVVSRITIEAPGPDEPPIIIELEEERGELGLQLGYLEIAPDSKRVRTATPRKTAKAAGEPDKDKDKT